MLINAKVENASKFVLCQPFGLFFLLLFLDFMFCDWEFGVTDSHWDRKPSINVIQTRLNAFA